MMRQLRRLSLVVLVAGVAVIAAAAVWLYRRWKAHQLLKPLPFGLPGVPSGLGPPPSNGGAGADY